MLHNAMGFAQEKGEAHSEFQKNAFISQVTPTTKTGSSWATLAFFSYLPKSPPGRTSNHLLLLHIFNISD